jgi:hypothetical protein
VTAGVTSPHARWAAANARTFEKSTMVPLAVEAAGAVSWTSGSRPAS